MRYLRVTKKFVRGCGIPAGSVTRGGSCRLGGSISPARFWARCAEQSGLHWYRGGRTMQRVLLLLRVMVISMRLLEIRSDDATESNSQNLQTFILYNQKNCLIMSLNRYFLKLLGDRFIPYCRFCTTLLHRNVTDCVLGS